MKIIDKVIPTIRVASTVNFTTHSKGEVVLPFAVNKSGKVKAVIYDHENREIKRVLNYSSVSSSGNNSLFWDGKTNKGTLVSDGRYKLVMSMIDSNKEKSPNRTVTIIVDTTKPTGKVGLYSPTFNMDLTAKPIAKLEFKEDVYVSAYVTTDKGIRVKKLTAEKLYNRGSSALAWDGKNDRGELAVKGKYLVSIKFRDASGNSASVKSSVFTLK
jgi:flagellar hook assembly protein FlgD